MGKQRQQRVDVDTVAAMCLKRQKTCLGAYEDGCPRCPEERGEQILLLRVINPETFRLLLHVCCPGWRNSACLPEFGFLSRLLSRLVMRLNRPEGQMSQRKLLH